MAHRRLRIDLSDRNLKRWGAARVRQCRNRPGLQVQQAQQFLVLDFPRTRSGRGVSGCGGVRAAQGADGTSAATYRPFRPESEASACRARRTGLQSTGAPSAADFSNSSSCACKPVSSRSHAQAGLIANPSSRPNADSIDRGHEWTRPTPTMRARGALERSGRGGLGVGL
jgi:hypothetical protein